jgi:hypothetical protein
MKLNQNRSLMSDLLQQSKDCFFDLFWSLSSSNNDDVSQDICSSTSSRWVRTSLRIKESSKLWTTEPGDLAKSVRVRFDEDPNSNTYRNTHDILCNAMVAILRIRLSKYTDMSSIKTSSPNATEAADTVGCNKGTGRNWNWHIAIPN